MQEQRPPHCPHTDPTLTPHCPHTDPTLLTLPLLCLHHTGDSAAHR